MTDPARGEEEGILIVKLKLDRSALRYGERLKEEETDACDTVIRRLKAYSNRRYAERLEEI